MEYILRAMEVGVIRRLWDFTHLMGVVDVGLAPTLMEFYLHVG